MLIDIRLFRSHLNRYIQRHKMEAVATELGVSVASVSQHSSGYRIPHNDKISDYCKLIGCDPVMFLVGSPEHTIAVTTEEERGYIDRLRKPRTPKTKQDEHSKTDLPLPESPAQHDDDRQRTDRNATAACDHILRSIPADSNAEVPATKARRRSSQH